MIVIGRTRATFQMNDTRIFGFVMERRYVSFQPVPVSVPAAAARGDLDDGGPGGGLFFLATVVFLLRAPRGRGPAQSPTIPYAPVVKEPRQLHGDSPPVVSPVSLTDHIPPS